MDWRVYAGSRIERMPRVIQPIAVLARNLKTVSAHHQHDGIATVHNDGFRETPEFRNAYERGVKAAGLDYRIPYRVHQALWCAKVALGVPGSFVELGTGRGFIMSAVMTLGIDRPVHLFDTFLPSFPRLDGSQVDEPSPHYAQSFEAVADNFSEWPNAMLHRGDVFHTLPQVDVGQVAFLHVDMNRPKPEVFGIRQLWPKMPKGAVMLLDDYAYKWYEPSYEAHNELAEELGFSILSTPTGQGIVIKSQ